MGKDLIIASTSRTTALTSSSNLAKELTSTITIPETTIRIPKKTTGSLIKGSLGITAFDISPDRAGRYVAGGADGQAHIGSLGVGGQGETSEGEDEDELGGDDVERLARRRMRKREKERVAQGKVHLKGHVGDLRSASFFPSGQGECMKNPSVRRGPER
jgi:hypothetical protein